MKCVELFFLPLFLYTCIDNCLGAQGNKTEVENEQKSTEKQEVPDSKPELKTSDFSQYGMYRSSGDIEDQSHECYRECNLDTPVMRCYYHFKVEWYITMSKACYDCPLNFTDCGRSHCVPTDGRKRAIVTVNRRFPGPTIQVCENDEIVVDVENHLVTDTTTIHWHGQHMRGTPYMDGVPHLTQCPISPGSVFRYHFVADTPGTHYWHSHSGFQRADGVLGNLFVKQKNDSHKDLYDVDDSRNSFLVTDWMEALAVDKFVNHHHNEHANKPYNILVNGLGRYQMYQRDSGTTSFTPLAEFRVKKGLRYRFRTISNSIQNCPIEMSIDKHKLLVIASDGSNLEPVTVESLVIYAGERWDFVVSMDQEIGTYWIKFRGLLDCDERFLSAYQVALLIYDGSTQGLPEPLENLNYNATRRTGLQLNKLNVAPGNFETFITAADVRGSETKYDREAYERDPDYKFWMDFDFYDKDNYIFHDEDLYPFYGVEAKRRVFLPQINNISLMFPTSPPLSQAEDVDTKMFCNSSTRHPSCDQFCHCVHTLNLELGSLVELILVDKGVTYFANHPFHIHGHRFAVLGMGDFGPMTTLEKVQEDDKAGILQRNFDNPPMKDSVTVPDGGYTILRFIADNPGYWLFHCHLTFHVEVGMALIFHTGNQGHLPPVPKNFPKCGSWTPKPSNQIRESVQKWSDSVEAAIKEIQEGNSTFSYYIGEGEEKEDNASNSASMIQEFWSLVCRCSFFVLHLNFVTFPKVSCSLT